MSALNRNVVVTLVGLAALMLGSGCIAMSGTGDEPSATSSEGLTVESPNTVTPGQPQGTEKNAVKASLPVIKDGHIVQVTGAPGTDPGDPVSGGGDGDGTEPDPHPWQPHSAATKQ